MTEGGTAFRVAPHRRVLVTDTQALRVEVEALSESPAVGVDLEMGQRVERRPGGLQEWKHILALIQIASDDLSVVVDPLRCDDLSPLRPLMAGQTRKVFLGGGQDVALLEGADIPARNIVDVGEVALGIWGRREDGMAALSRRMFGLSLDKTVRRADWLARPLNPTLLAYAHQDAELTLMIYQWFQQHYPMEVALHERLELDPRLDLSTPAWLLAVMRRSPSDALLALAECGLDRDKDREQIDGALARLLETLLPPRQLSRLLRVIGELEARSLVPLVLAYTEYSTSIVRAAAARTLGAIGELDLVEVALTPLKEDPVEDVRKAADGALKELRRPRRREPESVEASPEDTSIDEGARSALEALLRQMESGEE